MGIFSDTNRMTPGGSSGQLQFNNGGIFAGMAGSSWDDTNRALVLGGASGQIGLALYNATVPQVLRVFNTRTDASNGEWGAFDWNTTANVLSIGTNKNGTGATRNLQFLVGGTSVLDYGVSFSGAWALGVLIAASAVTTSSSTVAMRESLGLTIGSASRLAWESGTNAFGTDDLILVRDAANILAQRNGVTAQAQRVYNTFTDASNGEWGAFDWKTTANVLSIGTKKNGTGATRNLQFVAGGTSVMDYGVTSPGCWALDVLVAASAVQAGACYLTAGVQTVKLTGPAAGVAQLDDGSGSFARLMFGGATASFPAIKRSAATLAFRLADDSGDATISAASINLAASTTARPNMNLPATGVAPTSPNNGDVWFDGTNLKIRIGGATKTVTVT